MFECITPSATSVEQTGPALVDAVLARERNSLVLAKLRNDRIKASEGLIAKSLVGHYWPEYVFTLRQSLAAHRSYQKLLEDSDREIREPSEQFKPSRQADTFGGDNRETQAQDVHRGWYLAIGTEGRLGHRSELNIPGIRVGIVQTLFGEIGPDFTKFLIDDN